MKFIRNHSQRIMSLTKLMFCHIDDIWFLVILGSKDYGPEINRGYRYTLVVIDNFSKLGWTVPLKNRNAQTTKETSENFIISSERKAILMQTNRGKEFYNNSFHKFSSNNSIEQ